VLIAEPVRPLDGIEHMPLPVVFSHIAKRGGNTALRCNRMRACREDLGNAGRLEARFGHAHGGAQTGTASTDDNNIIGMVNNGISRSHGMSLSLKRDTENGENRGCSDENADKSDRDLRCEL